jgi:hypothetical protein
MDTTEILTISQFINPTTGFFKFMTFDFEFMTKDQLDFFFYFNYGDKNPAPPVTKSLSLIPTENELTNLAKIVESLYSVKWNKLKTLSKLQYDPIHNYQDVLVETVKDVGTGGNTTGGTYTDKGTDTLSKDGTRTDNLTNSSTIVSDTTTSSNKTDGIYGFNSTDASDSDKSVDSGTEHENSTDTITNTGTQKNVSTDTNTVDKTKTSSITVDSHSGNDRTRNSTHSGNIGNLTTQQLMSQEIELWKWNFLQEVLTDVKDFLTIPIYLS